MWCCLLAPRPARCCSRSASANFAALPGAARDPRRRAVRRRSGADGRLLKVGMFGASPPSPARPAGSSPSRASSRLASSTGRISVNILVMVIIGGMNTTVGPVLGAAFITIFPAQVNINTVLAGRCSSERSSSGDRALPGGLRRPASSGSPGQLVPALRRGAPPPVVERRGTAPMCRCHGGRRAGGAGGPRGARVRPPAAGERRSASGWTRAGESPSRHRVPLRGRPCVLRKVDFRVRAGPIPRADRGPNGRHA